MRADLHTHTVYSDGELIPAELVRRAMVLGHDAIAITDHVDMTNVEFVVSNVVKAVELCEDYIKVIPGVEITHVPPSKIDKVAKLARKYGAAALVNDSGLPAVAGLTDRAYLVDVLNAKVYAAGADRLGKSVVGVIFVVREFFLPALDKARGNGLCTDVHQSPLIELVFVKIDLAAVDRVENILRPRNEKPNDGAMLVRCGLDDLLGGGALKKHCL